MSSSLLKSSLGHQMDLREGMRQDGNIIISLPKETLGEESGEGARY